MIFSEGNDIDDPMDDSEESIINEVNLVALQATLDVIDEADRAILIMKYQDNLMVKDIANILNLSESAVKMRLKRAKRKISENIL